MCLCFAVWNASPVWQRPAVTDVLWLPFACVCVCVCVMGSGVGVCFWLMFVMITEVSHGSDLLCGVGRVKEENRGESVAHLHQTTWPDF